MLFIVPTVKFVSQIQKTKLTIYKRGFSANYLSVILTSYKLIIRIAGQDS